MLQLVCNYFDVCTRIVCQIDEHISVNIEQRAAKSLFNFRLEIGRTNATLNFKHCISK